MEPSKKNIYFTSDVRNMIEELQAAQETEVDSAAALLATTIISQAEHLLQEGKDLHLPEIKQIYASIENEKIRTQAEKQLSSQSGGMINLKGVETSPKSNPYLTDEIVTHLEQLQHGDVSENEFHSLMLASSIWDKAQEELREKEEISMAQINALLDKIVDEGAREQAKEAVKSVSEGVIDLGGARRKEKEPAGPIKQTTKERIENTLSGRNRFLAHMDKVAKYVDRIDNSVGDEQLKAMQKLSRFVFVELTRELPKDASLEEIRSYINGRLTEVDEIYRCIEDPVAKRDAKDILSVENEGLIRLIEPEDIVCDKSQGFFEGGRAACASHCMIAVERFLFGPMIENEKEIYQVIEEGIRIHRDRGFDEESDFSDVIYERIPHKRDLVIRPYQPRKKDWFISQIAKFAKTSTLNLFAAPASGNPSTDFLSRLEVINEAARSQSAKGLACGVITCRGETIVVGLDDDKKPLLFDSHGRKYKGMDKGASLLKFDSMEELAMHLQENVFKGVEEPFTMHYLIPEDWKQSERKK